jgi:hypothetical protein
MNDRNKTQSPISITIPSLHADQTVTPNRGTIEENFKISTKNLLPHKKPYSVK